MKEYIICLPKGLYGLKEDSLIIESQDYIETKNTFRFFDENDDLIFECPKNVLIMSGCIAEFAKDNNLFKVSK